MNYLQQNKKSRKNLLKKAVFAVIFLLLIGILNKYQINLLSGVAHTITSPIFKTQKSLVTKFNNFSSLLRSKSSLIEENDRLKQNLEDIEYISIINNKLLEENNSFKKLLGRIPEEDIVLATILSKPNSSPYDTLIVDIGIKDSIKKGDLVLALGDFIIGKVSKVYSNTAQVTLFSSPGEKITVHIGDKNILAFAEGKGGGNFSTRLPRGTEISEKDIIVLPNINLQVLGSVEKIVSSPENPFITILFKNLVNVNELKWVEIIRSK